MPVSAAESSTGTAAVPATAPSKVGRGARKCLSDLHAFNLSIAKDGYWLGGFRYGYGTAARASGYGWYGYPGDEYPAVA
jgi:hypothetical protein